MLELLDISRLCASWHGDKPRNKERENKFGRENVGKSENRESRMENAVEKGYKNNIPKLSVDRERTMNRDPDSRLGRSTEITYGSPRY